MKIADKEFGYYWNIIKWPLVVYIVANIALGFIFPLLILLALIIVTAYLGWKTVKEKEGHVVHATISGVFFGLIMGIISAVLVLTIGIIVMSSTPSFLPSIDSTTEIASSASIDAVHKVNTLIDQIIIYQIIAGAIITPIFYIITSAIISTIAGFIAEQTIKNEKNLSRSL